MTKRAALPAGVLPLGLNRQEAAAYLGLGVEMLDKLVIAGVMPGPIRDPRLGTKKLYDRKALEAAFAKMAGRVRQSASIDPYQEALSV